MRMRRAHPTDVRLPKVSPVRLHSPPTIDPRYQSEEVQALGPLANSTVPPAPEKEQLDEFHQAGAQDFLDREAMGWLKQKQQVAGFHGHRFTKVPAVESDELNAWQASRVELVGLLRHEEPVVYLSEHLPNMELLVEAETRPLTPFEQQALTRLQTQEDVVMHSGTNRITMLGSLRASNDCLQCHSISRGELLGALSYEFIRKQPIPVEEQTEEPRDRL